MKPIAKKHKLLLSTFLFAFLTTGLISCGNENSSFMANPSSESYSVQERCYVTFVNYDASILFYTSVEYGGTAVYEGDIPTRPTSVQYNYKFTGWDVSLTNITSDLTAIAQYEQTLNKFDVIFKNDDGKILYETEVEYGGSAKYEGDTPTKTSDKDYIYTFSGWDKTLDNITENTVFIATYTNVDNVKGISTNGVVEILNTYTNDMIINEILNEQLCVEFKEYVDDCGDAKFLDLDISMFDSGLYELDLSVLGEQYISINYLGFSCNLSVMIYEDLSEEAYVHYRGDNAWYSGSYDCQILNIYFYTLENNEGIATIGSPNSFIRKNYVFIDEDTVKIGDFLYDVYQKNQWDQYITTHNFNQTPNKSYYMNPYDCYGGVEIDIYSDSTEGYCYFTFNENETRIWTVCCWFVIEDNILTIPDLPGCIFEILDNNQLLNLIK